MEVPSASTLRSPVFPARNHGRSPGRLTEIMRFANLRRAVGLRTRKAVPGASRRCRAQKQKWGLSAYNRPTHSGWRYVCFSSQGTFAGRSILMNSSNEQTGAVTLGPLGLGTDALEKMFF